jgi:hypothetical protein
VRLPNADRAQVDIAKLRDYCLNPHHERGQHKARVFRAALGLTGDDEEELRAEFLDRILEADAVVGVSDGFGVRYSVDVRIEHGDAGGMLRTIWIMRSGEYFPRLITCYLLT